MSRVAALIAVFAGMPSGIWAAAPVSAENLPSVDAYDGIHSGGSPLGLLIVAAGFVAVGGWLLWISSRSRA